MEWPYSLELAWIWFFQQIGTWFVEPMRLISTLGNEEFFLFVMPILYWCINASLGIRVAVMLLLSSGMNAALKLAFHSPRPYWIGQQIQAYSVETSFGFPSGHAQNSAAIWGWLVTRMKMPVEKILLMVLIFLIGFSRIILGMHFISDVIGGWLIGGLLVILVLFVEKPVQLWLKKLTLPQKLATAAISAFIFGVLILGASVTLQEWKLPQEWVQFALAATPEEPINPININSAFTTSGTWLGMWFGVAWLYHRHGGYCADGTPLQRLLRYLIGMVGVIVFWYILGQVFPREDNLVSYLLRFVRYLLIGLWVSVLAPLIFSKLGLAVFPGKQIASLTP